MVRSIPCGAKRVLATDGERDDADFMSYFQGQKGQLSIRKKTKLDFRKVHLTMLKSLYEREISDGTKLDMFCSLSKFLIERDRLLSICSKACLMEEIEFEAMKEHKQAATEFFCKKEHDTSISNHDVKASHRAKISPMPSLSYMFSSPINAEQFQQNLGQSSLQPTTDVISSRSTWNFVANIVKMQGRQIRKSKDEATTPYKCLMSSVKAELNELKYAVEAANSNEEFQAEIDAKIQLWQRLLSTMENTFG